MQINNLIRKTKSVCPECLGTIDADILEDGGKVYMAKECPEHGKFRLLLSNHPWYYRQLSDFYFSLMTKSFPQRDYIVNLTNKCNLDCPICLADSNLYNDGDYPKDKLMGFLKNKRNFKIDLMGSEPTMREDLPDIISMIARSGNIAALHTNGIKISEFSYLEKLKKAGLSEVHLQFDGFDDQIYETIRDRKSVV
jgi:7,8-dihydro-6-hydroxymethylpterin dimethyltransferase